VSDGGPPSEVRAVGTGGQLRPMMSARLLSLWLLILAGTAGAAAPKNASRADARGLVKDAAAIKSADVVDIASGETKGSLTPAEVQKLSAGLRKAEIHDGALVMSPPPWDVVLVITVGKGKRYLAQLVGDQWLRLEVPDPLTRATSPKKSDQSPEETPDKRPSKKPTSGLDAFARPTSEVLLGDGMVVWKALERILGPTKSKGYLLGSPPRPGQ
jgi:hypothetical protein